MAEVPEKVYKKYKLDASDSCDECSPSLALPTHFYNFFATSPKIRPLAKKFAAMSWQSVKFVL